MQHAGDKQVLLDVSIQKKCFATTSNHDPKTIIGNIKLQVKNDELVVITGPSGCGKTTLLNIISNIDKDYEGEVQLPEQTNGLPISYVFQNPLLLPWRTVMENLCLALESPDEHSDELESLLKTMDLEDVKDKFPRQISVGMARRVSLARAFAVKAPLLLMDEPFVSLDEPTAERLRELLLNQLQTRHMGVLFVTHNLREALFLADRLVLLDRNPATIVEEISLHPTERGRDPATIERLRSEIIAKHPELLS